ncbi:DUF4198 domain-containing protein [Frigoriglobus tundricola]|uniref:Ring canal kelch-like protein n=1 Tax=Frigoriglobus tundricola TaxID=2774151 RepID=A0A6M5Z6I4_9BACT|nr:DUF4198 domain-containing protein [Frigoriglobus tundricola]QJX00843.1 Ring canal kelch-like protein [Frigoriglobus tundricola]
MLRTTGAAALLAAAALTAHAHFVFVVPDSKDPARAVVVFSEDLEVDENVSMDKVSGLKLTCRDGAGKDTAVGHKTGKHELTATVPGTGPRVVFGSVHYGVLQKGDAKPYLLAYHPKAIIGAVPADKVVIGDKVLPVELVPVASGSDVRFRFLAAGKPVADAEVTVLKPDGGKTKTKTNTDGLTEAFAEKGRYGAWARTVVAGAGELGGKKYDETRHYATLVTEYQK